MKYALVLVVALVACKQAKEQPPASDLLMKVRALSAKACACTDAACVAPLVQAWNSLTDAISGAGKVSGVEFTDEQVQGLATEDERFMKCVAALGGSSSATAAPSGDAASPSTAEPVRGGGRAPGGS